MQHTGKSPPEMVSSEAATLYLAMYSVAASKNHKSTVCSIIYWQSCTGKARKMRDDDGRKEGGGCGNALK